MSEHRDGADRRRYVDQRRARDIQDDRLGPDSGKDGPAPTGTPDGPGAVRRILDRIAGAITGGRPVGVFIALLAVVAVACEGAAPEAATPTSSPAADETPSVSLSDSTTCEDPAGDAYAIDPLQLPTDGQDPNVRAVDMPNASVRATRGGIVLVFTRDEPVGDPPTVQLRFTLWLQGEDGTTGVVRATREPGSGGEWDIRAGADLDDLSAIDVAGAEVQRTRTAIPIGRDALPVEPPFSWAVETALPDAGVADVCPNIDPGSPLAQPGALPRFPEDDTVGTTADQTVEIVGENYAFEGVPDRAEVDTRLTFRNGAEEPHELVLLRLDEDAPPVEEFVQMPQEQGEPYADLVGVSIAMPGQPGVMREGDLLLDEPGTYVLLCGFPTGVRPEFVRENVFSGPPEGPPPEDFGPPHVAQGMFASIEVGS